MPSFRVVLLLAAAAQFASTTSDAVQEYSISALAGCTAPSLPKGAVRLHAKLWTIPRDSSDVYLWYWGNGRMSDWATDSIQRDGVDSCGYYYWDLSAFPDTGFLLRAQDGSKYHYDNLLMTQFPGVTQLLWVTREKVFDPSSVAPVVVENGDNGLGNWTRKGAFMEIYVRAFKDSDGDGTGDLNGVAAQLDYLFALGIRGIWLMPVFTSSDKDHGYVTTNYRDIEPDYGTLEDFDNLLAAAHAKGIGIIVDYVINHASEAHPMFLESIDSTSPYRNWFVWESEKPSGWSAWGTDPWRTIAYAGGSYWGSYYGPFSGTMPDWNLKNPEVISWHMDNLRFWLNRGVDGFRFDAVGLLVEDGPNLWENNPANHEVMHQIQKTVLGYSNRYMVCEAPWSSAYAAPDSCGQAFGFTYKDLPLQAAKDGIVPAEMLSFLKSPSLDREPWFISNHDSFAGSRLYNQVAGNEVTYRLVAATYILGSTRPFMYYGEEVGLAGEADPDSNLRVPMSWTGDSVTAGFTTGTPFRSPATNVQTHNVEVEVENPSSLLSWYTDLCNARVTCPVFGQEFVDSNHAGLSGDSVLVFTRGDGASQGVVVINYGAQHASVSVQTLLSRRNFTHLLSSAGSILADGSGMVHLKVGAKTAVALCSSQSDDKSPFPFNNPTTPSPTATLDISIARTIGFNRWRVPALILVWTLWRRW